MPGDADFVNEIEGVRVTVTVSASVSVTAAPRGGVPRAVAVLLIAPASISAWVATYVAEHVVEMVGAKVVTGHDTADKPGKGSVTPTPDKVTLPALRTTKLYVTV